MQVTLEMFVSKMEKHNKLKTETFMTIVKVYIYFLIYLLIDTGVRLGPYHEVS